MNPPSSPPADPGAARSAGETLQAALRTHLEAVEHRSGEQDPEVVRSYRALRRAAADYDDALFDAHGEVTPFDLPEPGPQPGDTDRAPEPPSRFAVCARWDYTVVDADRLRERAIAAVGDEAAADVTGPAIALAALADTHGHGALGDVRAALEHGLRWQGLTTWVLAPGDVDASTDSAQWMTDPFTDARPASVLCRIDVPVVWTPDDPAERPEPT